MYLIQETFHAKPGKARELVKRFKAAAPHLESAGQGTNFRIMTDVASNYWTVLLQHEVEDIGTFITNLRGATASPEVQEIMKGYLELVDGGKREIFLLE